MVLVDGRDGKYLLRSWTLINSGMSSLFLVEAVIFWIFMSMLSRSSTIRPTSCGTISNVYSLISLGFCFSAKIELLEGSAKRSMSDSFPAVRCGTGRLSFLPLPVPECFRTSSCHACSFFLLPESCESLLADISDGEVCIVVLPPQLRYGDISFHFAKVCHPDIPARSASLSTLPCRCPEG